MFRVFFLLFTLLVIVGDDIVDSFCVYPQSIASNYMLMDDDDDEHHHHPEEEYHQESAKQSSKGDNPPLSSTSKISHYKRFKLYWPTRHVLMPEYRKVELTHDFCEPPQGAYGNLSEAPFRPPNRATVL